MFGASNIYGDLKIAIDSVFTKVQKIEQNYDEEFIIVDNTKNQNILPDGMNRYMKEIMFPSKSLPNSNPPDMAFGCFLGYTVKVTSTFNNWARKDERDRDAQIKLETSYEALIETGYDPEDENDISELVAYKIVVDALHEALNELTEERALSGIFRHRM